jgi:hypothetical protein
MLNINTVSLQMHIPHCPFLPLVPHLSLMRPVPKYASICNYEPVQLQLTSHSSRYACLPARKPGKMQWTLFIKRSRISRHSAPQRELKQSLLASTLLRP